MAGGPGLERRRVTLGGATLAYDVAGAGEALALVHGLGGSSRWWAKNVASLARHFRVYAPDLPGFGASRGAPRFALPEAAELVARWLAALDIERAHVIGHSMGGLIAAELAADHPERVDRLVLVDAAALPLEGGRGRQALALARTLPHTPARFLPLLAADARRAGPATLWSAARQLREADIRAKLARVQAPTLLVWGERDPLVPPRVGAQLAQLLPRAQLARIPRAGHNPMWERPGEFNHLVLEFLGAPAD